MAGINVVITRKEICEDDIIPLFRRFNFNKKIKIIALPTIITIPINSTEISDTIKKIERGYYHYYIFASSHAVNIFFETIKQHKSCNIIQNLIKLSENNSTTTNNCFIAIGPKTKKGTCQSLPPNLRPHPRLGAACPASRRPERPDPASRPPRRRGHRNHLP